MKKQAQSLKVSLVKQLKVKLLVLVRHQALSSQTVFNSMLVSKSGARISTRASASAALIQIDRAQHQVPAYNKYLKSRDWLQGTHKTIAEIIKTLPETDKKQYIDAYTPAERCVGGTIPSIGAEIDESSGSSGKPYNWIRGTKELKEMRRTLSRLATFMYGTNVVIINGFSMGAWATGTNVSLSLAPNGLIKSPGPDPEKMLSVFSMLGKNRTYIITGYPPFMLELIEYGLKNNFEWKDYALHAIVGGEAMSEILRSKLLKYFKTVTSAYGASDLDIGVACEFPLSSWIRRKANVNPELAEKLFGDSRRLPMLFQYDPLDYYVEQNEKGELVVTVNRLSSLSPRLRYNVHDTGGYLDFDFVIKTCKSFGLDPLKEAPVPNAGKHPSLPFLFIGGRSDSTISYLGANIYPEDVEQAIFGDAPTSEDGIIKGFAMELVEHENGQPQPYVYIELQVGKSKHSINQRILAERIVQRLIKNSRDFKTSIAEDPKAGEIKVEVYEQNSGPFMGMNSRIKRKYVITKPKV
jgi:phenylacetate-CoA ligase